MTISLNSGVTQVLQGPLFAMIVGSTLFIMLAAIATWLLRASSAAIRYSVWQTVFGALLFLPLATLIFPGRVIDSQQISPQHKASIAVAKQSPSRNLFDHSAPSMAIESSGNTIDRASAPAPSRKFSPARENQVTDEGDGSLGSSRRSTTVNSSIDRKRTPMIQVFILAIWTSVTAVLLARLIWGHLQVRALVRASILLDNVDIATRTGIDLRELNRTKLSVSNRLVMPVATGVRSPHILLPADSLMLSSSQLEMVIRHELAHVHRGDVLWSLIFSVTSIVYWFQPLLWIANWVVKREREQACDDAVLAKGVIPDCYAAVLLEYAAKSSGCKIAARQAVAMAQPPLERRLKAILNEATCRRKVGMSHRAIAAISAVALVIGIGMARPTLADKPVDAEKELGDQESEVVADNEVPRVLTGAVVDEDGQPLSGIEIELHYSVWKENESTLERVRTHHKIFDLKSDANGIYSLKAEELGESLTRASFAKANFFVWASGEGRVEMLQARSGPYVVQDGKLPSIELPIGRKISGRVVAPGDDPQGHEVLNPIVRVMGPSWESRPIACDRDGYFSLRVPAIGTIELLASADNFAATRAFANQGEDVGEIELQRGTRVSGRVLDQFGEPLSGVIVAIRNDQLNDIANQHLNGNLIPMSAVRTVMGGRFELPPFAGPCTIAVVTHGRSKNAESVFDDLEADDQPPAIMPRGIDLDGRREHLEITLQAGPTVLVSGTVRWPDGRPAADVEVQSTIMAGGLGVKLRKVKTNGDGKYELEFPQNSEGALVNCLGTRGDDNTWYFAHPMNDVDANQKTMQILGLKKLTDDLTGADWKLIAEQRRPSASTPESARATEAEIALTEISDRYYRESATESVEIDVLVGHLLKFEEEYRGETAALNALRKVLEWTPDSLNETSQKINTQTIQLLSEHYLSHPDLDCVMPYLPDRLLLQRTLEFLELAEAESPHSQVRATSLLVQANLLAERLKWRDYLEEKDWNFGGMSDERNQLLIAQLKEMSSKELQQQIIRKARKLSNEFGDLQRHGFVTNLQSFRMRRYTTDSADRFGMLADRVLFQATRLRPGQVVDDFVGIDVNGEPFKLSDFRGKVVMVMFSANWCGPCKAMYPECRELVRAFKDRPFQLISIMGDDKEDTVIEAHDSGEISWLTTWEGRHGATVEKWNITSWPSVFIIDHQGVIHSTESTSVDRRKMLEKLIKRAED